MELEDLFKNRSDEEISAFAFNMGRMVELSINQKTREINTENKTLKALILSYRQELNFQRENSYKEDKIGITVYDKLTELLVKFDVKFNVFKM